LRTNYPPINQPAKTRGIIDFDIFIKTPAFETEGTVKTFLRDGDRIIEGPLGSTNFQFVQRIEFKASADSLAPDVPPDADSTNPVAVERGFLILCALIDNICFQGMRVLFRIILRWMGNSQ